MMGGTRERASDDRRMGERILSPTVAIAQSRRIGEKQGVRKRENGDAIALASRGEATCAPKDKGV